jgi:uncharacterized membrane protein YozB (DUF420 family)
MQLLFGTLASDASDLSLILQIIVFIMLLVGFKLGRTKTKEGLKRHGILMRTMVVLGLVGILTVMVPSFVLTYDIVANEPAKIGFPLIFVHAALGATAISLGIALSFRKFGNVRNWMRLTLSLWLITLLLGFVIYVGYYVLGFPI